MMPTSPPTPTPTWAALADPHRRTILELLREAPRAVNELVVMTGLSQPGTSKHLRVLRDGGLAGHHRVRGARALVSVAGRGRRVASGGRDDVPVRGDAA